MIDFPKSFSRGSWTEKDWILFESESFRLRLRIFTLKPSKHVRKFNWELFLYSDNGLSEMRLEGDSENTFDNCIKGVKRVLPGITKNLSNFLVRLRKEIK